MSPRNIVDTLNLGHLGELGEVDPVAIGEPLTLPQQESLLHDGVNAGGGAVENQPLLG